MTRITWLSAIGVMLVGGAPGRSATDPDPKAVDAIFAKYDHTNTPGCAVGVFQNGQTIYGRGFGMADLNQGVPISTSTVFYIASTSKQFTAMSTALLAEQGKISLDDPVRQWVPELPAFADRVTIRNLVHHTSGIRDYLGLWGTSGRSFADEIPEEVGLNLIVRQKALDFEPGTRYSYSNSGYFLLSVIVHRASGKTLRQFAEANIFGPLGMTATHFHDNNAEIVGGRAEGYQPLPGGGFEIVRTSFALVGDGGLLTTIQDLARWDENFYANRLGIRGAALVEQVTTPGRLNTGEAQTYAFGLSVGQYRGQPVIEHGGSFIGYRAQLLRFPAQHFSVAVLCNDYTAQPERIAQQVADLYLAERLAPVAGPKTKAGGATIAADRLDRWVGSYELLPGAVGRVTRDGAALTMNAFGQTIFLAAIDDSTFDASPIADQVAFRMTAAGPALTVKALGILDPVVRLGPAPAYTGVALQAFAGRYTSDELDAWSVIEVKGDSLRARPRWAAWVTLQPIAKDRFGGAGSRVEFEWDRAGKVTGYRVSAGRMQNVGFVRRSRAD